MQQLRAPVALGRRGGWGALRAVCIHGDHHGRYACTPPALLPLPPLVLSDPPAANGACAGLLPDPPLLTATDNNNNGLPDGEGGGILVSPPPASESASSGLDLGQTIGVAVGCSLAVVLLVAALGFLVLKRGRRKGPSATNEAASGVQLKAESQAT